MVYVPPEYLNDTEFPTALQCARDFQTHVQMIVEKWERSFPLVDYYPLRNEPTLATKEENYISGTEESTHTDSVWGEDIPHSLEDWAQPHEPTTEGLVIDATDTMRYEETRRLNVKLNLQSSERELKRIGIDKQKGIIATIPTPILDRAGVTARSGDYFVWRGEAFEVLTVHDRGYWYNTNIFLYIVLDLKRKRLGS